MLHQRAHRAGPGTCAVRLTDFSDAVAAHSTQREAELGLAWAESYLEAAAYGRLDVEFVPLHRWLRAEQPSEAYIGETAVRRSELVRAASERAAALADPEFDFASVELVLTVFPSSHFGRGNAGGSADADGVTVSTTRLNTYPVEEPREPREWGYVGAHEIVHILGLLDMYAYDAELHALPELDADSGNGQIDDFPTLGVGDSVTLRGYTITVTAGDNDTHSISITRNS